MSSPNRLGNAREGSTSGFRHSVLTEVRKGGSDRPDPGDTLERLHLRCHHPTQRLIVERAFTLAKVLEATAGSAPHGQIIDRCKSFLLADGREFLRQSLEETLLSRVEALEKKGLSAEPAPAASPAATRGKRRV